MRRVAGLVLAVLAGPALAEGTAETRFGPVTVAGPASTGEMAGSGEEVRFGGAVVPGLWGMSIEVEGVWPLGAEDAVLLAVYSGGNDVCFDARVIVAVSAAGARATAPFGACGTGVAATRAGGARLEVDIDVTDPRLEHVTAVYAAGQVLEVPVPRREVPAPMPGPGADVTRWAGVHPWEIVQDPGERRRLLEVMPRGKLFELEERLAVGSEAVLEGGWLVAQGCMAHMCGVEAGAFALEVETGAVQAVLFHEGGAPEVFGAARGALIPALARFARTGSI